MTETAQTEMTPREALDKAIDLLGGVTAAARKLPNVKGYATVQQWRVAGVPESHCPNIELFVGGQVTTEQLRPDRKWVRIPDEHWPNPAGKPLLDLAAVA